MKVPKLTVFYDSQFNSFSGTWRGSTVFIALADGSPLYVRDFKNDSGKKARKFAKELGKEYNMPVKEWKDEER